MWRVFPLIKEYLSGATASSLFEARLIFEEMGVKAHTYAPVYRREEFAEILQYSSHLTFNSIGQYEQFKEEVLTHKAISFGIRVNPEWSPVETELYNPAAAGSRLGVTPAAFKNGLPKGIEGLHFHVLCESSVQDLVQVLEALEAKFGQQLKQVKWINMGGGHLMTRAGYEIDKLVKTLRHFRAKYEIEIILEPGSAIAWQAGNLYSTVLDVVDNQGVSTAMLDVSFTAHMPDTLEMPYRPVVENASSEPVENTFAYRLGGTSCLAGDYLAEYYFNKKLQIGDQIILKDMIHYTMVKTTMFNGVPHPAIGILEEDGTLEIVREFGYEDYKKRLG